MPRATQVVIVSEEQRKDIERWLAAFGTLQQVALRGRIILAMGVGQSEAAVPAGLNVTRKTVSLCGSALRRYAQLKT